MTANYEIGSGTSAISMGTWTLNNCNNMVYTIANSNFPATVTKMIGGTTTAPVLDVTATDVTLNGNTYTLDYVGTDGSTTATLSVSVVFTTPC